MFSAESDSVVPVDSSVQAVGHIEGVERADVLAAVTAAPASAPVFARRKIVALRWSV